MITFFLGIISIFSILYFAGGGHFETYMQFHSIVLVVFGTGALFLVTTPQSLLKSLGKALVDLVKPDGHFSNLQGELQQLMKTRSLANPSSNEMIQYASDLWTKGVDADLFIVLLSERKVQLDSNMAGVTQAFKNLSKYPPALGMCGTVMGMISLFSALDSHKESIGLSLSVAMTATFLGLFLSNFFLSPLADRLHIKQMQEARISENVYEVLLLINRDEPSVLIQEEINDRSA